VRPLLVFLAALLALVFAAPAFAHGTATFSVDVTEVAPGKALVRARSSKPDAPSPRVTFDAPCSEAAADDDGDALVVTCPGALAAKTLHVEGLGPLVSEAIVVVSLRDGRRLSRVLTRDDSSFTVPEVQGRASIAAGYVRLGVAHILTGYDHLLFLLALVLLLGRWRAVLLAETAFTVSHSLSFSATALGLVHVSAPAAEAAIALSLVLVALDIGRTQEAAAKGAMMAFVFGLVHGLGFASGLSDVGLPEQHVAWALLGFAGGVEIGQVAFLAVALVGVHLLARRVPRARFEPGLAVLIGGVASFWLLERTLVCLS
jgi:hydrogenase/urease accessory protein HupE